MNSLNQIIHEIAAESRGMASLGKVADYIPALAHVEPHKFGIAVVTLHGEEFLYGDATEAFSIQSISKVFSLALVFGALGESLWQRVGREPSGNPFNSLVQLEYERGRPRNPFINAGALVVMDSLMTLGKSSSDVLAFTRTASANPAVQIDETIAGSEKAYGHRNAALCHLMRSFKNIHNDVDDVLEQYVRQCSISMSCLDLARSFLFLANHGTVPQTGERILTQSQSKRLSALMLTCGLYDESGDFAFRVGLPGKSGVGGGIVAIIPGHLAICVWSPPLNEFGNSVAGIQALELFTTKLEKSIF